MKNGLFINPIPNSLSDLQNDYNYLITKEYKLNESNLSKSSSIIIDDIKAGSTIVEISLKVNSAFTSNKNTANTAIEIVTDSGKTLFSKNINDMNVTGNYMTDCYYVTNGNENELIVNHTLKSIPNPFVAVSNNSYFAYSTDGINWTEGTISNTGRIWFSICYGNGKYVAVALDTNYFAYSMDGITWTEGTISDTSRNWHSVCYGNDKFIAVANNSNNFAYSYDGITWTEGMISDTSRNRYSICCSNNSEISYGDAVLCLKLFENCS